MIPRVTTTTRPVRVMRRRITTTTTTVADRGGGHMVVVVLQSLADPIQNHHRDGFVQCIVIAVIVRL